MAVRRKKPAKKKPARKKVTRKKAVKKTARKKTVKRKSIKKRGTVKKSPVKKTAKRTTIKRKKRSITPMARKKKRTTTKRRKRTAIPKSVTSGIMTGLLSAGGAIGGSVIANQIPIKDPRIKAAIPLVLGIGLGLTKFGKGKMLQPALTGLMTIGTISLIKQFAPNIPMLAGEGEEYIPYEDRELLGYVDDLDDDELMGISTDMGADYDYIDDTDMMGESVDYAGDDFITSADY